MSYNVPRTGARNPVLRLRQGYGACALLAAGVFVNSVFNSNIFICINS